MTNKEIFENYYKEKIAEGLTFVNFYIVGNPTREQFYAEFVRMINAPDLPDVKVLGKYSPE